MTTYNNFYGACPIDFRRKKRKATKVLDQVWQAYGLPIPVPEHKFHPTRKWLFDFAWPDYKVAVEIEGIFYRSKDGKSRHQTGSGYAADMEKYNAAIELGWYVLRYLPNKINFDQLSNVIKARKGW